MKRLFALSFAALVMLFACGPEENNPSGTDEPGGKDNTVHVTGISLDRNSATIKEGETITLVASVAPENATNPKVLWTSEDDKVATVSNGLVTAISAGTTIITASAGSKTATCIVTVIDNTVNVTSITLNKNTMSLVVGSCETLTASINPDNATNVVMDWSSSDDSVATVDEYGMVRALKAGKTTVTVTAGGKSASCVVTVKSKDINPGGIEGTTEENMD